MDTYNSNYCGKLTRRPISTEEDEMSWDISSCRHECYKGVKSFKSPEFHFADATWILFTTFATDSISFGIVLQARSNSVEMFDFCCNLSYRNLDGEVFKSFELKFKYGESMPLLGMKDFFKLKKSLDYAETMKNIWGNAVIVCQFNGKRLADITCSSENKAEKVDDPYYLSYSPFRMTHLNLTYFGTLTSTFISTEKEELIWDISRCFYTRTTISGMCSDFNFADSTWYMVAEVDTNHTPRCMFGIDMKNHCSSDEVFDCCCNISLQNFEGKVIKRFKLEFKCDKTMPLIGLRDYYFSYRNAQHRLTSEEGVLIVCQISSKKLNVKEACSSGEITYSGESSVVEVRKASLWPEQKDDGSTIVNPICKSCQDFRQLLKSEEGSDVILQVGDQAFKAHRAILTARSSVFASMFRHNMKEKATGVVNVEDCDASSFPVLLEFLYCGSTEKISEENVFGLYTSSDKYDLQDLKMKCLEFIKNNISVETFCDTVKLSLRHSESELLKLATNYFSRNFKEIIVTVNWQNFIVENPIQSNEILIKALASGSQDK